MNKKEASFLLLFYILRKFAGVMPVIFLNVTSKYALEENPHFVATSSIDKRLFKSRLFAYPILFIIRKSFGDIP